MIWSPAGQITQPPSDPRLACPKAWSSEAGGRGGRHSLCRWLPGYLNASFILPSYPIMFLLSPGDGRRSCHQDRAGGCFGQRMRRDMPLPASAGGVSHWAGVASSRHLGHLHSTCTWSPPLIDTGVHVCTRSWDARVHKREEGWHVQPLVQELDPTSHAAQPKDR